MTGDPVAVVERARAVDRPLRPSRPRRAAGRRPLPTARRAHPGAGGRRVQAGQEPAGERPGRRARLPDVRRRRHGRAHRRAARRRPLDARPRWPGPDGERIEIPVDELADHVCEQGNPGNREGWATPRSASPGRSSSGGLVLVDTPGVGGLGVGARGGDDGRAAVGATPCCWSPTPRRSTPRPELEFLAQRRRCARTSRA